MAFIQQVYEEGRGGKMDFSFVAGVVDCFLEIAVELYQIKSTLIIIITSCMNFIHSLSSLEM